MKAIRLIFALALVIAGVLLLLDRPISAQTATKPAPAPALTRITIVDEGTAGKPDVVLIPGLGSSRAVWDAEAKLLAPNYRLHLVQLNGFAGSPAGGNTSGPILPGVVEDLHAYIAAQGMHPALVGHSMGGLLALMLADKYPADVRKMVIVDTLPFYALLFAPTVTVEMMKPQAEIIRQQVIATPADQYAAMQQIVVPQLVGNKDAQKLVEQYDIDSDRTVFANSMAEDLTTDLRGDVATIKTPALVMFAVDASAKQPDPAQYEALVRSTYKPMPNVTLLKIDNSKHFIMYDQPEKMDAAMEGFLK
jgi:pimeloyl-ACP methyl ester carboxylesterase